MKEATGEANMTIITIALIAVVLIAGTFIVKVMMNSAGKKACESEGGTYTPAALTDLTSFTGDCQYQ